MTEVGPSRFPRPRPRALLTAGGFAVVIIVAVAAVVQGCQRPLPPPPPYVLHVLGSSELGDMAPILRDAARVTGVSVKFTPIGSVAGAQDVISGAAQREGFEAVWFASDNYLNLFGGQDKIAASYPIMESPVILGVRSSVAARLGWDRTQPTWDQVAGMAEKGAFTFGITDPASSNSGLSAIVSLATTVAGLGAALQERQVTSAIRSLTKLFGGQVLKRSSSGYLTDAFLRDLEHPVNGIPGGIFDYESQLLEIQADLQHTVPPGDQLTLVYPSGQALVADYKLAVLGSAPPQAMDAWRRLADYLRGPAAQARIMQVTHRRPVGGTALEPELARRRFAPLPFPDSRTTVTELIEAYAGRLRRPGRTIYVLDVSMSMSLAVPGLPGQTRLSLLKQALGALTEAGLTQLGKLIMFQAGEEITFLPFNNGAFLKKTGTFTIPATGDASTAQAAIRRYIGGLSAARGTWLYNALESAYQIMAAQDQQAGGRIDSIVVLSDGWNTGPVTLADFLAYYRSRSRDSVLAPVYPIGIGGANVRELQELADATNGYYCPATGPGISEMEQCIQKIRGSQ
jgi:Ca-activated chloride channel family protein